jgi:hypothetical protein
MSLNAFLARRWVSLAVVLGTTASQPVCADTGTVLRVDTLVGGGLDTDPYLTGGADRASAFVDAEVRPVLTISDDRGGATFEAYYRRKEYLRRYPGTDGFGFVTRSVYRPSERTRLSSSVVFDDAILDAQSLFGAGATGTGTTGAGGTLPIPTTGTIGASAGDVGLIGLRQRRSQLLADVTFSIKAGLRDEWALGLAGIRARYPGTAIVSNYSSYGVSGTYTRLLNERHTVGVTTSVQDTRFQGVAGLARVVSSQIVYQLRLPHNWSVNLTGGASLLSGNAAAVLGQSTSAVFQAEICSNRERVRACFSAARTVAPSGTSGVGPVLTGRAIYVYRFNRTSDLAIEANFSSVDRRLATVVTRAERFSTVSATYSRSVADRIQFVASARYERREGGSSPSLGAGTFRIGFAFAMGRRG